jgi:hypothetical protein
VAAVVAPAGPGLFLPPGPGRGGPCRPAAPLSAASGVPVLPCVTKCHHTGKHGHPRGGANLEAARRQKSINDLVVIETRFPGQGAP